MNLSQTPCTNFDLNYATVEKVVNKPELFKKLIPKEYWIPTYDDCYLQNINDLKIIQVNGYRFKCSIIYVDYSIYHGWDISNSIIIEDNKNEDEFVFSFTYNILKNYWYLTHLGNRTKRALPHVY